MCYLVELTNVNSQPRLIAVARPWSQRILLFVMRSDIPDIAREIFTNENLPIEPAWPDVQNRLALEAALAGFFKKAGAKSLGFTDEVAMVTRLDKRRARRSRGDVCHYRRH